MMIDGYDVYRHPNYQEPDLRLLYDEGKEYPWRVVDSKDASLANFTTEKKAKRWLDFMSGKRKGK